ncbi:hypothetical protein D3C85_1159460 [compost metagenome]
MIKFIVDNGYTIIPDDWFRGGFGVYLHGDLEERVRYDIPACSIDLKTLEDGIYDCMYDDLECSLYFWKFDGRLRGLVVLKTDKQYIDDAKEQFDKRMEFL